MPVLTTGDVGVVVEQHHDSRLTPIVAVLDQEKALISGEYTLLDLKDEEASRKTLVSAGRTKAKSVAKLAIARDLESSGYDVDLSSVSSVFMKNSRKILESTLSNDLEKERGHQGKGSGFFAGLREHFRH